jgi:hypothetical protein
MQTIVTGIVGFCMFMVALANMTPDGRTRLRSWAGAGLSLVLEFGMPLSFCALTIYGFSKFENGSGVPSREETARAMVDVAGALAGGAMFLNALNARVKRHWETMQADKEAQRERFADWEEEDKASSTKTATDPDEGLSIRKIGQNITVRERKKSN